MIQLPGLRRTPHLPAADFEGLVNQKAGGGEEKQRRPPLEKFGDDSSGAIGPVPRARLLALPADPRPHTSEGVFGVVVGDGYCDAVVRHCCRR